MIIGRPSIFGISFILTLSSFGLQMIYFIVFGDITKSLISQVFFEPDDKSFSIWKERGTWVILLGASLFPLVIKKELKELKAASVILFAGISSFILILTFQFIFEGNNDNDDEDSQSYFVLDRDLTFVKGVSMILVAFGC